MPYLDRKNTNRYKPVCHGYMKHEPDCPKMKWVDWLLLAGIIVVTIAVVILLLNPL